MANLLPTEPQTTNDTLAAIVRDPVVQDAVQDTVGDGPLEGLVVKKKVLIMPATEPNKVRPTHLFLALIRDCRDQSDIFVSIFHRAIRRSRLNSRMSPSSAANLLMIGVIRTVSFH